MILALQFPGIGADNAESRKTIFCGWATDEILLVGRGISSVRQCKGVCRNGLESKPADGER